MRKQVALVGKLQVCPFLKQIITSRLNFYTTRFWIGPHNLKVFFGKKPWIFGRRLKHWVILTFLALRPKVHKKRPGSIVNLDCAFFLNALVFNVLRIGSGVDLLGPLPFRPPWVHNLYFLKFLGGIDDGSPRYSGTTGLIYIFNLIVGTGALTLPAAFHDAGWALGTAVIVALAFMSYLTTTFVIEAMAAANAMQNFKRYIQE